MLMNKISTVLSKNAFLYLIAMLIPQVAGFFMIPLYSLYISPADYGVFGYTNSFVAVLNVFSYLGLNVFYLRNYARTDNKRLFNGTCFYFMFLWNSILVLIEICVFSIYWKFMQISFNFWPYMFLTLLTQYFNSIETIPIRTFRLRGEAMYYTVIILSRTLLSCGFGYLFVAFLQLGVLGRYYSELVHTFVFGIIYFIYMYRNSSFRIKISILKEGLKFGLPIVPADLLLTSSSPINAVIIEKISNIASFGIYSLGNTISSAFNMLLRAISLAVEPELYMRAEEDKFKEFACSVKNIQILAAIVLSVGLGIFIKEIIQLLLSPKYYEVWLVVQALALSQIIYVLRSFFQQIIIIQGKTKLLMFGNLLSLIVTSISLTLITKLFGIVFVGWSITAGYFAGTMLYYFASKEKDVEYYLRRDLLAFLMSSIFVYGSRILNVFNLYQCLILKMLLYLVFTIFSLKLYNINLNDIVNAFRYVKKKIALKYTNHDAS